MHLIILLANTAFGLPLVGVRNALQPIQARTFSTE